MVLSLLLQASPLGSQLGMLVPLILVFGIFYVLVFLPEQRRRRTLQKMLSSLQNGQIVVTSGGIVGTIVALEGDDTVVVRVKPDNVKLQITRSSVSSVVASDGKK